MKSVIARFLARRLGDDWGAGSPLRFAVSRLREYKLMAFGVLVLSILTAAFEGGSLALITLAVQVMVSQKVDESFGTLGAVGRWSLPLFEGRSTLAVFVVLVVAAVLIQILRSASTYAQSVAGVYLRNRVARRSIFRAYERVLALDFSTIIRQKGGEISYKATAMPNLAQVIQQLINALQGLTMMLGYTVLLLLISPLFALVVVAGAIGLNYTMGFAQRAVRRNAEHYTRIQQETTQVGAEMFQSFRLVHTHATWDRTARELKDLISRAYLSRRKFEVVSASVGPIFEVILISSVAAILIGTVVLNADSRANAFSGTLVSLLIVYRAMPWANTLNHVRTALAESLPPLSYAAALFNDPQLKFRPAGLKPITEPVETISFEQVCYAYPASDTEVLSEVSFNVDRGQCIALVGASGSGKSTLTDLFIGLRSPMSGTIRVNGRNLEEIDPASWRAKLGVVSQDTFLFNMSLR
ncbi:MAG TPA: ABC transporter ATP-binding protein, partial [Blastocatellia bacterium]|nr:ABC transporter ATP-binding protein [Blastocatellia bacterium]